MKKFVLCAAAFLFCAATLFAGGSIKVVSGDASILKSAEVAKVIFNYDKTYVGEDGAKTQTLKQYLKSRGSDFVRDWPEDHKKAENYFVIRFNKKNKRGLTLSENGSGTKYIFEVKMDVLDMGNAAGAFVGFGAKAGGVIAWGDITVKDARGKKVLLKLRFDDIKGKAHPSETMRLGLCYMDLATRLAKIKAD